MRYILTLLVTLCVPLPHARAEINRLHLGAQFDASGTQVTFRVYSSRASRIEVYMYAAPTGSDEAAHIALDRDAATSVWSTTMPVSQIRSSGIPGTIYYGYRAWGPNWAFDPAWVKGSKAGFLADVDANGNRFNPNKLLFDPYAWELSQDPVTPGQRDGSIYASGPDHFLQDSGRVAPKGVVMAKPPVDIGTKPSRPLKDDIVYEAHVRGLTNGDTSIPTAVRGTYAGAALKAAALKILGVTAVEFLPVQETENDGNELVPNSNAGDNYWGYASLSFFAPDRRYSSDKSPGGPTREFQKMVKAYHDAGLKVFIDVVYNHTGEGYAYNPSDKTTYNILSWRGLDNPTYYSLTDDFQFSWAGTGGNYNTVNTVAQDLIVDSLAWWRDELGVDGFRFDLASVLGNVCEHGCFQFDKMDPKTALNRLARDLTGVSLIAEPWAIGDGTYQVGNFPSGWSEWNDKFRDTVRRSQNKLGVDTFTTGQLATRFAGSSDLMQNNGRRPWNSVNFVVAHDGFTLADLYRFNGKNNNQPYPKGPSDGGSDNNIAWDQGGNASDQRKAARNGIALLMLSAGTPMMTGGDEFLRSLNGNNNPYNLDTSFNWLNYTLGADQKTFRTFVQRLLAFRSTHPAVRPDNFYSAAELQWLRPDGGPADAGYFDNPDNHAIGWLIQGADFADPASAIFVAYNAWSGAVTFQLPPPPAGKKWFRSMDTSPSLESTANCAAPGSEQALGSPTYNVGARSVLLAIAR
jgi:glycogen operon protein